MRSNWPGCSHRGMGDMLLGGIMAMIAQSEHRKERAKAEDLTEAMTRLGLERRRLGTTSAIVRADGSEISEADTKLLADTVVAVAKEREVREADVRRRRAEYDAKQRAAEEARRKAEYDATAAPFRRARALAKLKTAMSGAHGKKPEITAELFELATGTVPAQDDLQRCNCPEAGKIGHEQCGWCLTCNKPRFMCLGIHGDKA